MTQEALRLQLDSQIHIDFLLIGPFLCLGKKKKKKKKNENVGFCGGAEEQNGRFRRETHEARKSANNNRNRHVSPNLGIEPEP